MIFITAKFRVRPEDADDWPSISKAFTEATRGEPGCLWFDWSRSLDDPTEYLAHSPISYASRIRTPVLILHSEEDLRCPIEQAEQLFVALRLLGRDPVGRDLEAL